MKKLTNLGLKRLKKGTAKNYFRRAQTLEKMIMAGKFRGIKLRQAKKRYQFCMWKVKRLSAPDKSVQKLAQIMLPTFLSQSQVVGINELLVNRAVKLAMRKAKVIKTKKKSSKRKAS